MALALEMGLDPEGDRAIRGLWSRLERLGVPSLEGHVPSIRPHLSLTVTDDADGLRLHAPGLALSGVETDIEMAAVSLFPADRPLLVLAVAPAPELVALHERVSASLVEAGVDVWPHYRPAPGSLTARSRWGCPQPCSPPRWPPSWHLHCRCAPVSARPL